MNDDLKVLDAQDKRRTAKMLEIEARVAELEIALEERSKLQMVVSVPRWVAAYVLFSLNMFLFYYDVRVFFGINVVSAIIIALVIIPISGYFFLTGMGLIEEGEKNEQ